MVPAYFSQIDRNSSLLRVEFAFQAHLPEWQAMFREIANSAGACGVDSVFIDCRAGIKRPLPTDIDRFEKFVASRTDCLERIRTAILMRKKDPVTELVVAKLLRHRSGVDLFHDDLAAWAWLEKCPARRTGNIWPFSRGTTSA